MLKKIILSCLFLLQSSYAVADASAKTINEIDAIVLTFLGTGAPRPSLERYGPSILVEAGGHKILLDAGSGMRERLFEIGGFPLLTSIDTFLITHLHFDHTISVPGLWLSGWLFGRRIPMQVYGPPGTEKMMAHIRKAYQWDIDYRAMVGVPLQGSELIARDLKTEEVINIGELKISSFAVEHMPIDIQSGESLGLRGDTLGFRIDYKGRSVVFSGDTRSTDKSKLIGFAKDVDVLIHEVQVPSSGNSKEANLANVSLSVHSSPEQTGYILSRTKPRLAVYSHIIPPGKTKKQLLEATRPFYKGPLTVAHDFMRLTIDDEIRIETVQRIRNHSFEDSNVLGKEGS